MVRWRAGRVTGLGRGWPGAREVDVEIAGQPTRALAYPDLVGPVEVGDDLLLNTAALDLGLGTGGYALVIANVHRLPADADGPGHLVKARYTPVQTVVLGVEEPASPHHAELAGATSVQGMPVVVADLHSALPAVVVGVRESRPDARIAYVMSDGGALPLWYSRTVAALRPYLCGTVSAGQAFGGDLEAVTVHTALLAARHVLRADLAVLTQGPGNLGTGTTWGFSGVASGEAVNAAAVLDGRPVGTLRISGADPRPRHRGVSHHSLTAYGRVALAPADLVVPAGLERALAASVAADVEPLRARHRVVTVDTGGLVGALRASPVPLETMGRALDDDPAYFLAAAAGGRHAASLL